MSRSKKVELESEPAHLSDEEWEKIFEVFQKSEKDEKKDKLHGTNTKFWLDPMARKLRRLRECGNVPATVQELDLRRYPARSQINDRFRTMGLPFRLVKFDDLKKIAIVRVKIVAP